MKLKGSAEDIMRTLLDVLNQACQVKYENNKCYCDDFALSEYENAFYILEIEGFAEKSKRGKYSGRWLLKFDNEEAA